MQKKGSIHNSIRESLQSEDNSDDQFEGPASVSGNNNKHSKAKTSVLKRWLLEHLQHPYLKAADKEQLAEASGLSKKQVQNWFTNIRKVHHLIVSFPFSDSSCP
jgi:Homeobox KN domain